MTTFRLHLTALLVCTACNMPSQSAPASASAEEGRSQGAATPLRPLVSPPPAKPPPPPPLPDPVEGTFALNVGFPVAAIEELIAAQLPAHQVEPKRPMTRSGASPYIEASYQFWRDAVKVELNGATLEVEVPIRYAARFDARMKAPFGGGWMTVARDEPWGTEAAPLNVTVKLQTQIDIADDWTLSLKTTVGTPKHGPPPDGRICTGGSFKLCMKKEKIAPTVQRQLDAELLRRVRPAIASFDREAVRTLALRSRVAQAFAGMTTRPRPAEHNRWMTLTPTGEGIALSLSQQGKQLVAEVAFAARHVHHEDEPTANVATLPNKRDRSALPNAEHPVPDAFIPDELRMFLAR